MIQELYVLIQGEPMLIAHVLNADICEGFRQLMHVAGIVEESQSICVPIEGLTPSTTL